MRYRTGMATFLELKRACSQISVAVGDACDILPKLLKGPLFRARVDVEGMEGSLVPAVGRLPGLLSLGTSKGTRTTWALV